MTALHTHISFIALTYGVLQVWNIWCQYKTPRRVVRIILSVPARTESFKMFNYLKILSVFDVYVFMLSMFASKYGWMCYWIFFIKNSEIQSYETRQAEKMHVPKYNKTAAQKIVRNRCVKVWNYVSTIMSTQCSIVSFKSNLKSFLLKYGAFDKMHQCVL